METLDDLELEKLVACCARWSRRLKLAQTPSWISLLGKTGTGKTHCGNRLWNYAEKRFQWHNMEFRHAPVFWPKFVSELRAGDAFSRLRDMARWPVLFVDDLGAERDTTGFAAEQLNTLLGSRVGKWTIITSNLYLEQLAAIDPRISDRIIRESGNVYIELTTQSYAVRKLA